MTEHVDGIHAEVEEATMAALRDVGPRGIKKANILRPFLAREEVGRATLYRWVNAKIARAKAEAEEAAELAARPKPTSKPKPASIEAEVRKVAASCDTVAALVMLVPEIETLETAIAAGKETIPVIAMLRHVVENVTMLMEHAKTPDGSVRNARLLLQSSDALRRTLGTTIQVFQAMRDVDQVDRFHAAIIEEVAKEEPAVAERILRRMDAVAAAWGG